MSIILSIFYEKNLWNIYDGAFLRSKRLGEVCENVFLKFLKIHRETPVLDSLFNKVAGHKSLQPYQKKDSNTGFLLQILQNF